MSWTERDDKIEADWLRWWNAADPGIRARVEAKEAEIGARLTWNNRYLLVRAAEDADEPTA